MRLDLPVCVAASIAVLWLSLPFVILGCKALPLPTDQQDLPRTERRWVNPLDQEKATGWNPPDIVIKRPDYDPTLFCQSPVASNPSRHPDSPSGGPPAAVNCQPSKSPVDPSATTFQSSHGVNLKTPPTPHQVASPIHGELYKDRPNTPSSSTPRGKNLPSGSQPPDTNPVRITSKVLNEKWLRYLSNHAKYPTFWKGYREDLHKKWQELSEKGGTEAELDQKLEKFQVLVYEHHRNEGRERREKLNRANPIQKNALKELEEWERLRGDDQKDSELQKALKVKKEKYEVQAIAVDPLNPTELDPKDMEKLMLIFRMERKDRSMRAVNSDTASRVGSPPLRS